MADPTSTADTARLHFVDRDGDRVRVHVPHSDYELRLTLENADADLPAAGKRMRGVISAEALRVHPAAGGGRFIEPVSGEPRIVAGVVREIRDDRVLVDVGVPMWLELGDDQDGTARIVLK